jgi:hypothetical protein
MLKCGSCFAALAVRAFQLLAKIVKAPKSLLKGIARLELLSGKKVQKY